jgi:hypothetical protein
MILRLFNKEKQEDEVYQHVTYFEQNEDHYYIEYKHHKHGLGNNEFRRKKFNFSHIKGDS